MTRARFILICLSFFFFIHLLNVFVCVETSMDCPRGMLLRHVFAFLSLFLSFLFVFLLNFCSSSLYLVSSHLVSVSFPCLLFVPLSVLPFLFVPVATRGRLRATITREIHGDSHGEAVRRFCEREGGREGGLTQRHTADELHAYLDGWAV